MGSILKKLYCFLNAIIWFTIIVELFVLTVYRCGPEKNKHDLFFNVVAPWSEFVALILYLLIPIILVICLVLLIRAIIQKNIVEVIKTLSFLIVTILFFIAYCYGVVTITGGV